MNWLKRKLSKSKANEQTDLIAAKNPAKVEETVNVFDFETKTVSKIPARELSSFMVEAQLEGVEGMVWIDVREVQQGEHRHPPFTEDVLEYLREIKSSVDEFYCLSMEEWEDGFRRDTNYEREIAIWLHLARVYRELTTQRDLSYEQRHDYFKVLLTCLNSPRDHVLQVFAPQAISVEEANDVIAQFYGGNG